MNHKKCRQRHCSITTTHVTKEYGEPKKGEKIPKPFGDYSDFNIDIHLPIGDPSPLTHGTNVIVKGSVSTSTGVTLDASYTSPGGTNTPLSTTPVITSDGSGGYEWFVPMVVPDVDPNGNPYTFNIEATVVAYTKNGGGSITVVIVSAQFYPL
jgi:hypothetical protein